MEAVTAIAHAINNAIKLLTLYLKTSEQRRRQAAIEWAKHFILLQGEIDKETDPKKITTMKRRRKSYRDKFFKKLK